MNHKMCTRVAVSYSELDWLTNITEFQIEIFKCQGCKVAGDSNAD